MRKRRIVGPAIVGNIVEYYDFGLYAVYAAIIGRVFFPADDPFVQTLLAFATFAVGFLMRPLGGMFFGYIGDKFGRKISLSVSILGMALSTFMIGVLPGHEVIGIAAPIMLVIVRLFQGLCVGGEGAAAAIFVIEHTEGYRPGFMGSIVMASNMVGTLLAVFVGIIINTHCMSADCWRYAFIFGGLTGLIGLYLRYQLSETPQFEKKKQEHKLQKNPLALALKTHFPAMVMVMMLGGLTSAIAYTIRGYMNIFFQEVMHYSSDDALTLTSLSLIVMIIFLPLFGLLSDTTGYRKFFYKVCAAIVVSVVPLYIMISCPDKNLGIVVMGLIGFGIMSAAVCAPAYSYAIKSFEVELRFSGVAFSWNLGLALMGGTTPMISRFLSERISVIAPAYYLMSLAILFILISVITKRYQR